MPNNTKINIKVILIMDVLGDLFKTLDFNKAFDYILYVLRQNSF